EDASRGRSGYFSTFGDVRADRKESRFESAAVHRFEYVVDSRIELEVDAEREYAIDFAVEDVAGKAVLRYAEAHHAARHRAGFLDGDVVTHPREMVCGSES